jgi:hypothetical protein
MTARPAMPLTSDLPAEVVVLPAGSRLATSAPDVSPTTRSRQDHNNGIRVRFSVSKCRPAEARRHLPGPGGGLLESPAARPSRSSRPPPPVTPRPAPGTGSMFHRTARDRLDVPSIRSEQARPRAGPEMPGSYEARGTPGTTRPGSPRQRRTRARSCPEQYPDRGPGERTHPGPLSRRPVTSAVEDP